jgi:hypothetical protein
MKICLWPQLKSKGSAPVKIKHARDSEPWRIEMMERIRHPTSTYVAGLIIETR